MTDDTVNATLVPLAAELVATVRDYGPDDVAAVLARVPDGRHDALAVVLAAMVDPDKRPSQLLAWTRKGPVQSRDTGAEPKKKPKNRKSRALPREHGSERGFQQHRTRGPWPACGRCRAAHSERETERKKAWRTKRNASAEGLEVAS